MSVNELNGVGPTTVAVGALTAQRRHLVASASRHHGHRPVLQPGRDHMTEATDYLLRAGVGGYVPVLRLGAAHEVADTPADDPTAFAHLAKPTANAKHVVGELSQEAR